jgi:general stress protein YciG
MAATREGGIKAAITNKKRYGHDHYAKIGKWGGIKSRGGGFAKDPQFARAMGVLGGLKSRRRARGDNS